MSDQAVGIWVKWFSRVFLIALLMWMATSAALGIPHGPGHSIERMTWAQTIRDITVPIWTGAVAGVIGLLAVRACRVIK